jgi:hypothetical protein
LKRLSAVLLTLGGVAVFLVLLGGTASANQELFFGDDDAQPAVVSGAIDFKDVTFGTTITECPQAGHIDQQPKPLDRRDKDPAEQKSSGGNDRRLNQVY